MVSAKSTGMEVNNDFTTNGTIISSSAIEYCLSSWTNSELFLTVQEFFRSGAKIETRCLDTAYVGLPMLLVIGVSAVSQVCEFWGGHRKMLV